MYVALLFCFPSIKLTKSSVQAGAFFGVMAVYFVNERFGRRFALLWASVIFNIGVILSMASLGNIPLFYVGRIISGLGVGATTFAVPQYLSECAPASARGGIVGCVWRPPLKTYLTPTNEWLP
jgi:MFS family permease